ncbi:MAG: VolA/Pla-1 family phospholipase [Glaciecola sp.]|jgi:Pla-1/cef family extracellular lipase
MKKLFISSSIATALALAGCGGGETISDLATEAAPVTPSSRVVFDPANGNLNIPNDLLMLPGDDGFFDYTLNIPVGDPTDYSDPQNALNVLDGWSTNQPFVIDIDTAPGVSIDPSSLSAGVHIFEATLGLNQSDPVCAAIPIPSAGCKIGDKLQFGVDYILSMVDGNTISVVPLKPFKPAQGHMLVVTNDLMDTAGNPVQGSTTWTAVSQDPAVAPLASDAQLSLQNLVNTYITSLETAGLARENISYAAAFTTQSTMNVLDTIKKVMVGEFAARAAAGDPTAGTALPAIVVSDVPVAPNAMEALGLVSAEAVAGAVQLGIASLPAEAAPLVPAIEGSDFSAMTTCAGLLTAAGGGFGSPIPQVNEFAAGVATGILSNGAGPFCAAKRAQASITLPHYLAIPRADNPLAPVNEFMTAACDSGIVLAGFAGLAAEVQATFSPGPNDAACQAVGLRDLRNAAGTLDRDRNLTKFSPVPQPKGADMGNTTLDVQVTVPDPIAAGALGFNIAEPENGWPVVILYHGITRQKEDMLAITGALSLAGLATVAIDHPLHGSRGYDLDGDGNDDVNATTVSATHYMNLATLPTAKGNLTQSVSDLLGVRLGLNAVVDTTASGMANLDANNVSVMGVSLGAITGGNFAAVANTSMGGALAALDGMFEVKAAALESPGAGTAAFLLESASFGPLIKSILMEQAIPEFAALVASTYPDGASEDQKAGLVAPFFASLSAEQAAAINAVFTQFMFAAQTSLDAADPISYVSTLGMNTPSLVLTVVGDGGDNLPDQVIPVSTALPLAGQDAYVEQAGIMQASSTIPPQADPMSAYVLFNEGAHGSSLSPASSARVTVEMQQQIAAFLASGGRTLPITNTEIVVD